MIISINSKDQPYYVFTQQDFRMVYKKRLRQYKKMKKTMFKLYYYLWLDLYENNWRFK
jgi:hypothetical protein